MVIILGNGVVIVPDCDVLIIPGGGFFLACENFGGRFEDSFPVSAFLSFLSGDQLADTNSTF